MPLLQLAILLGAAVLAVPLFKRAGLGTVLGYLAAGALIGPSGLGLIHEVEHTMHVAELGVVFLLFLIGLELQPSRLWKMRGQVFGLGGAQVGATALLFTVGAWLIGLPPAAALIAGFGLSLSSTALVIQLLGEKNELTTGHGRASFGILLFQDLAAIPALALVPLLGAQTMDPTTAQATVQAAAHATATESSPLVRIALIIAVITGLVLAGRFLLRPLFRFVASTRSHEVSAAWALLVVIGTAMVMQQVGLSMALGAFLAGVLLADSEYRHELEANIEPFKGLLLGLFFMTVGMSASIDVVLARPALVIGLAITIVVIKLLVLFALGRMARLPGASAISLGVTLSQGGEFAFVIYGVARQTGALSSGITEILVVAVTLSIALTPLAFMARDQLFRAMAARQGTPDFDRIDESESQVIIAGFGRYGQIVARTLRGKRIRCTVLEVSPAQVDFVRRFGNKIYYGDASRVDLLRAAKADEAKVFVLAIDDPEASLRTAKTVREHFPQLPIVARARNRHHAHALRALGIDAITREVYHSSLITARQALEELGLSAVEAKEAARTFRNYDEAALREQFAIRHDEAALIESARKVAADLERLFEQDARADR